MILGGSHRDIPLINASKSLGHFVITLGDRDYYLGHDYADKAYKISFNNLTEVRKIIESEKIDYLVPGSGEASYLNTVQLSQELGIGNFDTVETAKLVHNKWQFKEFCLENSILTPGGFYYEDDLDLNRIKFPVVVKPVNLSGGAGINIVDNLKDLKRSLLRAQEVSNRIFLEEYIDGELIAYSAVIKYHKVAYSFTGIDSTYKNPYLISSAYPKKLNTFIEDTIRENVEKISSKLLLVDGVFHLQIIIKNDLPYIIDVTRRIPGDLYPYLMEFCDSVEYSKAAIKSYIGDPIESELHVANEQKFVIRHCVMSDKNGIFEKIQVDDSLQDSIIFRIDLMDRNSEIINFLTEKVAIIFIQVSHKDKNIVVNHINELIYPVVTPN